VKPGVGAVGVRRTTRRSGADTPPVSGGVFVSPSRGRLSLDGVFEDLLAFMAEDRDQHYTLIIGSDSQVRQDLVFVTAVVIHRAGKGARYYYQRVYHRRMHSLRQRIFYEASLSLSVASELASRLARYALPDVDVEIHLDVGEAGETRDLIREIVGMVSGSGFDARIKPDAYAASSVADRYTKQVTRPKDARAGSGSTA
jgi:predicted RNase H-related nuclease YkuK (DUF458 family)